MTVPKYYYIIIIIYYVSFEDIIVSTTLQRQNLQFYHSTYVHGFD